MAFRDYPDCRIPNSAVRCEAMTKPNKESKLQVWKHEAHRCVRHATQGRAGRGVCALHDRVADITWWNGESDKFRERPFPKRRFKNDT